MPKRPLNLDPLLKKHGWKLECEEISTVADDIIEDLLDEIPSGAKYITVKNNPEMQPVLDEVKRVLQAVDEIRVKISG